MINERMNEKVYFKKIPIMTGTVADYIFVILSQVILRNQEMRIDFFENNLLSILINM